MVLAGRLLLDQYEEKIHIPDICIAGARPSVHQGSIPTARRHGMNGKLTGNAQKYDGTRIVIVEFGRPLLPPDTIVPKSEISALF